MGEEVACMDEGVQAGVKIRVYRKIHGMQFRETCYWRWNRSVLLELAMVAPRDFHQSGSL